MIYALEKRRGVRGVIDSNNVIVFSTNDYLSLSCHPDVEKAAIDAIKLYGSGTGGAPGTTGTTSIHIELSKAVAEFKSREIAVLFPSGYQANIALHHALGTGDTVFFLDKRHHPSAIDGARLPKDSKVYKFDHHDLDGLETLLKSNPAAKRIVSLPSVFTIDGDIAPLDKLIELKDKHGFILVLDEAHASGCVGKTGRGLEEHFGLKGAADFIMGTFSKAFGSSGGFVAYDEDHRSLIKPRFRQFDYSTSISAVTAAAALKALELLKADPGMMESLWQSKRAIIENCHKKEIDMIMGESMIILVPCQNCEEVQRKMVSDGFLIMPAEAEINGEIKSCIRITANAAHDENDIEGFARALSKNLSL
ncbi:MAG: pyridoxal phosphate-dependent aminotransferase family protein [candidate division Zixibacteria bacterium]